MKSADKDLVGALLLGAAGLALLGLATSDAPTSAPTESTFKQRLSEQLAAHGIALVSSHAAAIGGTPFWTLTLQLPAASQHLTVRARLIPGQGQYADATAVDVARRVAKYVRAHGGLAP